MSILTIRFEDTACVLLNNKGEMLGTRVNGIVSSALRDAPGVAGPGGKWSKVLALASKVSHAPHFPMV
jgi:ribosomal protein L14